jgi:outer membrane receptor protein involved in Fe transport
LFLADRYPGEFNKNSELFQGFLSDPLAFGASNRFSSLLQRSGHYGTAEFNYDKTLSELSMPSVSVNGLANSRTPIAYFAQVQRGRAHGFPIDVGVSANLPLFEDSSGRADVDATVTTLGLGLKPTENLGVFVYHNAFKVKLQGHNAVLVPGELDFFEPTSTVFDVNIQQSALGFSYRWSPTSQTWLKFGRSQAVNDVSAFPVVFVTESSLGLLGLYAKPDKKFDDIQLQHTQDLSEATRISVGLEHVKETQYSEVLGVGPLALASNGQLTLSDYVVFGGRNDIGRDFTAMTLSARHQASSSVLLDASLTANQLREKVDGQNELVSVANETVKPTQVLTDQRFNSWAPRLGVVYQPNDALSIRAAYQDWVRPLSVSSLNSVQTAGIALEDRLVEAGGRLKRSVVQMGLTLGDSTHLTAKFDHQKIHNPVAPGVDLRTPSLPFLEALRNAQNVNLSTLDVLEDTPSLEDASLNAVSFGINRLLTPSLSGHAKYTLQESSSSYAESDEPSGRVQGKRIAYLPRNTLALGATWANGQRLLLGGRATYRSDRFEDMQNLTLWPASWSVDLLAFWETKDKRWSLTAAALNLGGNKSVRQSERYVVDARYRF